MAECQLHNYVPLTIAEDLTRTYDDRFQVTGEKTTRHIVGMCTFCGKTGELDYPIPGASV